MSISTVSRVLNNSASVSEATKRKVIEAVELLKYKPNQIARSLVKRKTRTIGVILPDIRNPFFAEATWILEKCFRKNGFIVTICNSDNNPQMELSHLGLLAERQVDGIVFINGAADQHRIFAELYDLSRNVPIVLLDKKAPKGVDIPSITMNNELGGQMITDHLIELGHKNIAYVTSRFTVTEREREVGYRRSLVLRDTPSRPLIIEISEGKWQNEKISLNELVIGGGLPSAIFASNDFKACVLYGVFKRAGYVIGHDISLVGYDDTMMARMVSPALTTIKQPIQQMAIRASEILMKLMAEGGSFEANEVFEPTLVVRDSSKEWSGKELKV